MPKLRSRPPKKNGTKGNTSKSDEPVESSVVEGGEEEEKSISSSSRRLTRGQSKKSGGGEVVQSPPQQEGGGGGGLLEKHGVRKVNNLSQAEAQGILRKKAVVQLGSKSGTLAMDSTKSSEAPANSKGSSDGGTASTSGGQPVTRRNKLRNRKRVEKEVISVSEENGSVPQRKSPEPVEIMGTQEEDGAGETGRGVTPDDSPGAKKKRQRPTRRKRVRNELPPPPEEEGNGGDASPQGSPLLPDRKLFPGPSDPVKVQREKLPQIKKSLRHIFGLIFNQSQEEGDHLLSCYQSMERIFEFFDNSGVNANWGEDDAKMFGQKYRKLCVEALYDFGAVIWKRNMGGPNRNPFVERASKLLEYSLVHLGWNCDKRSDNYMNELKNPAYQPASFSALTHFHKNIHDYNPLCRQHQLSLLLRILEAASNAHNYEYIRLIWTTVGKLVCIRIKDKSSVCRLLVLKILSHFVVLDEAKDLVQKEMKYYTRYDPCMDVRRLGTKIIAEKTKMKLRFFHDQAFDKSESVRVEAFKAMAVVETDGGGGSGEEEEGRKGKLVRAMNEISSDKLCKAVIWGTLHSGAKCSNILKSEILPKWLEYSCNGDLVKFLTNMDAYQHMKAVIKIMDMLFTTQEQERFVEGIDLKFLPELKTQTLAKDYKPLTVEAFVAWLGLCKASEVVESIRCKVIPSADEMLAIVGALHECVLQEHEDANQDRRDEDITPVFCLVIALEISNRFIAWEEGNRREFVEQLKNILLDPLLDDRVIVIQAINTLHSFVDNVTFEDKMMSVFQEVFDPKRAELSRLNGTAREFRRGVSEEPPPLSPSVSNVQMECDENIYEEVNTPVPPSPLPPPVTPKTPYELTKMRAQLCDLGLKRLQLQKRKEELLREKMYIDAIPVNNQIMMTQQEEADLKAKLQKEEEILEQVNEAKRQAQLQAIKAQKAEATRQSLASLSIASSLPDRVPDEGIELGEEDKDEDSVANDEADYRSVIITTVEEGLSKGICMINAYLDMCPKIGPFVRNIYDSHVAGFMQENDVNLKLSVLQFLTRIGMIDKREMRKVYCFMLQIMTANGELELRNVAFQSIVDLIICYEYADFCLTEEEKAGDLDNHPYIDNMTRYIEEILPPDQVVDYIDSSPDTIQKLTLEVLTKKFPGDTVNLNLNELNLVHITKNVGLIKLLVRGRLRDPVIVSRILCLWVDKDYSGTAVLRDLEHVLKLYRIFEWWGPNSHLNLGIDDIEGEIANEEFTQSGMMRVLGLALGHAVVLLCQDPEIGGAGKEGEELIFMFINHFLSYLEHEDQPLMRAIVLTILNPISGRPTRSYNNVLVKCASRIPITSIISAKQIMVDINETFIRMKEILMTPSVLTLRKELHSLIAKFKRLFGNEIATVRDADGNEKIVGEDLESDEDGTADEEVDGARRSGSEDSLNGVGRVASFDDDEEEDQEEIAEP